MIGINPKQLLEVVINPTLIGLGLYTPEAANLLLGTAAVESNMGHYLDQLTIGPGPAFGIYQMELATHNDIVINFLSRKPGLVNKILSVTGVQHLNVNWLPGNLYYATAMARVHYLRINNDIPISMVEQAKYWKKYYNTVNGSGSVEKYMRAWSLYNDK